MDDERCLALLLLLVRRRVEEKGIESLMFELQEMADVLQIPVEEVLGLYEDAMAIDPRTLSRSCATRPSQGPKALISLLRDGEVRPLGDVEEEMIRFAIAYYRWQMSEVAQRLEIGRSTLYRKLRTIDAAPVSADTT